MTDSAPHAQNNDNTDSAMLTQTTSNQYKPISFDQWPEIMSCDDIMACCGLSLKHALKLLRRDDLVRPFPNDRRNMLVGKYAFRDLLNGRIVSEDANKY